MDQVEVHFLGQDGWLNFGVGWVEPAEPESADRGAGHQDCLDERRSRRDLGTVNDVIAGGGRHNQEQGRTRMHRSDGSGVGEADCLDQNIRQDQRNVKWGSLNVTSAAAPGATLAGRV